MYLEIEVCFILAKALHKEILFVLVLKISGQNFPVTEAWRSHSVWDVLGASCFFALYFLLWISVYENQNVLRHLNWLELKLF